MQTSSNPKLVFVQISPGFLNYFSSCFIVVVATGDDNVASSLFELIGWDPLGINRKFRGQDEAREDWVEGFWPNWLGEIVKSPSRIIIINKKGKEWR